MSSTICDETLVQRLALPLAQLFRRAHNAKTPLERHLTAYYLWEAALKMLGSVAVVTYAEASDHDVELTERLTKLARPSIGDWWDFVRRLTPVLADKGHDGFGKIRDLLLGRARDDMPRAAGLDAALRETLEGKSGARATVYVAELFDRLVRYRNREIGHGAAGQQTVEFYERMSKALLAGVAELLGQLDVLAGRRLVHIAEVRQAAGHWLIQRYELVGESPRRIESLELPRAEAANLPDAERLYLDQPAAENNPATWCCLHPLVIHDAEAEEVLFLNARRGHRRTEYLCYTTGRRVERQDLGAEQRALLTRILGISVSEAQVEEWTTRSQAEETPLAAAAPQQRLLGEFELLSELGRGGMGVVYRAWQPSLGRQVALKKLQKTGDAKIEARFAREIRALGRVEHPNLVKIFTSGSEGDQWYYAMELVEGAPLSAVCEQLHSETASATDLDMDNWQKALSTVCEESRRKEKSLSDSSRGAGGSPASSLPAGGSPASSLPAGEPPASSLPAGEPPAPRASAPWTGEPPAPRATGRSYIQHIVELMRQAAGAAHALHEAGIIHRDIKPGNIIVTSNGAQGVLIDPGLAQLADEVDGRLTRTRQFVGTLRYASPQQVLAVSKLDRRSDIYSLGATLWELLTLKPLYGATDATPTPELMERIQRDEPERLRQVHPGIPRDLEAIVHKCLEKTPERRYATAAELADDLGRFLGGKPVQARPVTGFERALRWVKRHPATAAVWGLVLLVTVLGVIGGSMAWLWHEAETARKEADVNRQKAVDAEAEMKKALEGEQQARRAQAAATRELEGLHYIDQITLAQRYWKAGEVVRARETLNACKPGQYHWEWGHLQLVFNGELSASFDPDKPPVPDYPGSALDRPILKALAAGKTTSLAGSYVIPGDRTVIVQGNSAAVHEGTRQRFSEKPLFKLEGHTFGITVVVATPDGRRLVSGSRDKTAILWDAADGKKLLTFKGHNSAVMHAVFSPDGKRLITGCAPQVAVGIGPGFGFGMPGFGPGDAKIAVEKADIRVWDATTGKEIHSLPGHEQDVACLDVSPNGKQLASASADKTVILWDLATGKKTHTLVGHQGPVLIARFSPDGSRVASACGLNSMPGMPGFGMPGFGMPGAGMMGGLGLGFGPPGPGVGLAPVWLDSTIRIWDAAEGKELQVLGGHAGGVNDIAFSPDGLQLASAGADQAVRLWDVLTGQEVRTILGHTGLWAPFAADPWLKNDPAPSVVAFSSDGERLFSATSLGGFGLGFGIASTPIIKIWDAVGAKETSSARDWEVSEEKPFKDPFVTPGAMIDVTKLEKWSVHQGKTIAARSFHDLAGNKLFVTGHYQAGAKELIGRVWDLATSKETCSFRVPECRLFRVSAEGGRAVFLGDKVSVWDVARGKELYAVANDAGAYQAVFSPDGERLVLVDPAGASVCSAGDGKTVFSFKGAIPKKDPAQKDAAQKDPAKAAPILSINKVLFSPDGKVLVSIAGDHSVTVWDAHGGKQFFSLDWAALGMRSVNLFSTEWVDVGFSPDSRRLLTAGVDGTVKIREATTGKELFNLLGHAGPVVHFAHSPDGKRLVTASTDGTLKVWDTAHGRELLTLVTDAQAQLQLQHRDRVTFSPDGSTIFFQRRLLPGIFPGFLPGSAAQQGAYADPFSDPFTGQPAFDGSNQDFKAWVTSFDAKLLPTRWESWHQDVAGTSAQSGDWHACAFHLAQLIKKHPQDLNLSLRRAEALEELENWQEAHDEYTRSLQWHEHALALCLGRAHALLRLEKRQDAYREYARGAKDNPEHVAAVIAKLASADALPLLDEFIEKQPRLSWFYLHRAERLARSDPPRASADYAKADELNPAETRSWTQARARELLSRQRYHEALFLLDQSIKHNAKQAAAADAYLDRFFARAMLGKEEGETDYLTAAKLDPAKTRKWTEAKVASLKRHDLKAGQDSFERNQMKLFLLNYLLKTGPGQSDDYVERARALLHLGKLKEADADYVKALELNPDQAQVWHERGVTRLHLKDTEGYAELVAKAFERFGGTNKDQDMMSLVSLSVLHPQDRVPAARIVELARKTVRAHEKHNWWLGAALYRAGQYEECVKWLENPNLSTSSPRSCAYLCSAMAKHRLGQTEAAKALHAMVMTTQVRSHVEMLEYFLWHAEAEAIFKAPPGKKREP